MVLLFVHCGRTSNNVLQLNIRSFRVRRLIRFRPKTRLPPLVPLGMEPDGDATVRASTGTARAAIT